MIFQESETVELKAIVVEDIKKEIIAFANCEGGKLYIGVQDDGIVSGLDNPGWCLYKLGYCHDYNRCYINYYFSYGSFSRNFKMCTANIFSYHRKCIYKGNRFSD